MSVNFNAVLFLGYRLSEEEEYNLNVKIEEDPEIETELEDFLLHLNNYSNDTPVFLGVRLNQAEAGHYSKVCIPQMQNYKNFNEIKALAEKYEIKSELGFYLLSYIS